MTIIEGKEGITVVDPLVSAETAKVGMDLYFKNRGQKPVVAVIYTHSHVDHYGGVRGVVDEADVKAGKVKIYAPAGFMEAAVAENIMAGNVMSRRASYMYGNLLKPDAKGQVGAGLGTTTSAGTVTLIAPTNIIEKDGQKEVIDGLTYDFMLAPGSEAPSEMLWFIEEKKLIESAEDVTHTLHNTYSLRGAKIREPLPWSKYINEAIVRWGDKAEVLMAQHHWPTWGNDKVVGLLKSQRDLYRYINDQTLRMANEGLTRDEIAANFKLPDSLAHTWANRGYYGSVSHDVNPNDIDKIYTKLLWAGASVGRSGMAVQAISPIDIALWDMKAKRAGLPLAKLLGAHRDSVQCYNTSGGFLHTPLDQVLKNVVISRENGIGGIKLKVGQPNCAEDIRRLTAVREALGDDFPLMVDANQQWDRETAIRMGRKMEQFNLIWIEEPLDAYDVEGHAQLAAALDTPIATGEMLTSFREHEQLILGNASDFVQPDAPRVGGISPFLKIMDLAAKHGRKLAPHFAMEVHLHLSAAYPLEPWLEHFEWLNPLFNEQLELRDGRMWVSDRHGLGFSISEQTRRWTQLTCEFGKRP